MGEGVRVRVGEGVGVRVGEGVRVREGVGRVPAGACRGSSLTKPRWVPLHVGARPLLASHCRLNVVAQ